MELPRVEVEQVLPARLEEVYQVLRDMERFPEFMKSVESITVRERGTDYTVTEWIARLQGARFRWVERDQFLPERIVYRQVEGDLKTFEGEWRLSSEGQATRVTLVTDFEFGIPMLSQLLNPVAKVAIRENARAMLDAIARQVG